LTFKLERNELFFFFLNGVFEFVDILKIFIYVKID